MYENYNHSSLPKSLTAYGVLNLFLKLTSIFYHLFYADFAYPSLSLYHASEEVWGTFLLFVFSQMLIHKIMEWEIPDHLPRLNKEIAFYKMLDFIGIFLLLLAFLFKTSETDPRHQRIHFVFTGLFAIYRFIKYCSFSSSFRRTQGQETYFLGLRFYQWNTVTSVMLGALFYFSDYLGFSTTLSLISEVFFLF